VEGFELRFESISSFARLDPRPTLGRNSSGIVIPFDERSDDSDLVTGARKYPTMGEPRDPHMFPRHGQIVKLGAPGQVAVVGNLALARWARTSRLPHLAIELYARSTYPNGDRAINYPWWIAWEDESGTWTLAELADNRGEANVGAPTDPKAWSRLCQRIGVAPKIWRWDRDLEEETVVLARWQRYRMTGGEWR
jgi:hypothetical protein